MTNFTPPRRSACIPHERCRRITESDERRSEINGIPGLFRDIRGEECRWRGNREILNKADGASNRVISLFSRGTVTSTVSQCLSSPPSSISSVFHPFSSDNFRSRASDIPIERDNHPGAGRQWLPSILAAS